MFETYLKGLKGGQLIAWALSAAAGFWQFADRNGVDERTKWIGCGVSAAAVGVAFFVNPKARAWAEETPADTAGVQDMIDAAVRRAVAGKTAPRNFSEPTRQAGRPLVPVEVPADPPAAAGIILSAAERAAIRRLSAMLGDDEP